METTVAPGLRALEALPVLDETYHQQVDDLYRYALAMPGAAYDYAPYEYESPYADSTTIDLDAAPALAAIGEGAAPLITELDNPDATHQTLDTLIKLQAVAAAEPQLTPDVQPVMDELDLHGIPKLENIIASDDELARVKALRIICGRAASSLYTIPNLGRYLPAIAALQDAQDKTARRAGAQLYEDIMAVTLQRNRKTESADNLLRSLMNGFGQDTNIIFNAWETNGSRLRSPDWWAQENFKTMFAIEKLEPGMCAKLTRTFGTKNFARRTPEMLIDMYKEREAHPEKPYVLSLVGVSDHNLVGADELVPGYFYDSVKESGLRLEEHEVTTIDDIERVGHNAEQFMAENETAEIVDVVIDSHGYSNNITLSDRPRVRIEWKSIWRLEALLPAMRESARFILLACSSANKHKKADSIAKVIADALGHDTVGPTQDTAAVLGIKYKDGEPRVEPLYRKLLSPHWRLPRIGRIAMGRAVQNNTRRKRTFAGSQDPNVRASYRHADQNWW